MMANRLKALYDNARKKTFEHNGAKITVRESLGIDKMDMAVYRRFVREGILADQIEVDPKDILLHDIDWNRIINFVAIVARTLEIKGKMPNNFKLPSASSTEEEWYAAYWAFLFLPGDLIDLWDDELIAIDKTEPDPEAKPDDEKSTTNT
ncbi:MAG: hypothetical protein ACYTEQ_23105 [Planctomycetota bacterium]|jgi:hypothetical protein